MESTINMIMGDEERQTLAEMRAEQMESYSRLIQTVSVHDKLNILKRVNVSTMLNRNRYFITI